MTGHEDPTRTEEEMHRKYTSGAHVFHQAVLANRSLVTRVLATEVALSQRGIRIDSVDRRIGNVHLDMSACPQSVQVVRAQSQDYRTHNQNQSSG